MKFLGYLNEEYYNLVDGSPVFKNPTSSDYTELRKAHEDLDLRFLINASSIDLYVWYYGVVHSTVIKKVSNSPSDVFYAGLGLIGPNNKILLDRIWERSKYRTYLEPVYERIKIWPKLKDKIKMLDRYFASPITEAIDKYYSDYTKESNKAWNTYGKGTIY
jgi:hypothetical protein